MSPLFKYSLLNSFDRTMMSKLRAVMVALFANLLPADTSWRELKADAWAQAHGEVHGADRAQSDASRAVALVVGLTVAGIVAAFLIPVAIDEIVAVDTSNWSDGATSLWDILDLILVLAVFLFLIGLALMRSNGV